MARTAADRSVELPAAKARFAAAVVPEIKANSATATADG